MAKFCIHHFGQLVEEEARRAKAAAYRDLLRMKVRELPDDAMAWTQLGLQEYECSREPAEPLRCFERALALEPRATPAALFKGMIYLELGQCDQALAALDAAHPDQHSRALREHLRGDALHNLGRLQEACTAYRDALRLTGYDSVLSSKLGYTEVGLGRREQGMSRLREAARKAPENIEIRQRLMKVLVGLNHLADAAEEAEELASLEGTGQGLSSCCQHSGACQATAAGERSAASRNRKFSRFRTICAGPWLNLELRQRPRSVAAPLVPLDRVRVGPDPAEVKLSTGRSTFNQAPFTCLVCSSK